MTLVDDRCKCAEGSTIAAPWPYMGPWHESDCWLYAVGYGIGIEELLTEEP